MDTEIIIDAVDEENQIMITELLVKMTEKKLCYKAEILDPQQNVYSRKQLALHLQTKDNRRESTELFG